jgi:hypothetical protein
MEFTMMPTDEIGPRLTDWLRMQFPEADILEVQSTAPAAN